MSRLFLLLLSIPKSFLFNLVHLPLRQAIKFPIVLTYRTKVRVGGKISLNEKVRVGMIRIGFHHVTLCNDSDRTVLIVEKGGVLEFRGSAHIGNGTKIHVTKDGYLTLGDNFAVSASSAIKCYHRIEFGRDIQFSWNCLVMDSDTHKIYDQNDIIINDAKCVRFGDKVWIGCNTTILKGTSVPSNCVIGANSLVSGDKFEDSSVIIGCPAKSVKKIVGWKL